MFVGKTDACAITVGWYFDSYNMMSGIDGLVPVDVYVPGCPSQLETLVEEVMLLQKKQENEDKKI